MAWVQHVLAASLIASSVFGKDNQADFVAHPVGHELGQWALGLGVRMDVLPGRLAEAE